MQVPEKLTNLCHRKHSLNPNVNFLLGTTLTSLFPNLVVAAHKVAVNLLYGCRFFCQKMDIY